MMDDYVGHKMDDLFENLFGAISVSGGGVVEKDLEKYQGDPVSFGEEILKETYTDDIKKMMESVRDNPITIAKSANATGKTHGAARVAAWFYKCFPGAQVYTAAAPPEDNLKRLLWGEIGDILNTFPELFPEKLNVLHIERSPKSFLTGVTIPTTGTSKQREAKFSGKHAPFLLFIIDEGDAVPDEVYSGIESCMSGGHARLLIMFNPRSAGGEPYRLERESRANVVHLAAFNHPNVQTGKDMIPGAVTAEKTVQRINKWCRPLLPGEVRDDAECFELPAFLEYVSADREDGSEYEPLQPGWYKVLESAFYYMVLGEYPAQAENQLISRDWINKARARWDLYVAQYGETPPEGATAIMGLDVAEQGIDSNIACFRWGGWVEPLIPWEGVDTIVTGDRGAIEYKKRRTARAHVDATGVGTGVAPHMCRKGCLAVGEKVASSPTKKSELGDFQILRDQLYWQVREWLRADPWAMIPPDEKLIEELAIPTYKIENGKVRVMKKDTIKELIKRSPDRFEALMLTFSDGVAAPAIVVTDSKAREKAKKRAAILKV